MNLKKEYSIYLTDYAFDKIEDTTDIITEVFWETETFNREKLEKYLKNNLKEIAENVCSFILEKFIDGKSAIDFIKENLIVSETGKVQCPKCKCGFYEDDYCQCGYRI
jgi:hypothetical protein